VQKCTKAAQRLVYIFVLKFNQMKRTTVITAIVLMIIGITACSKKNSDSSPTTGGTSTSHTVYFKAIGSTGSSISVAVYGYDSQTTTATSLSGSTWTSPTITVPAGTRSLNCAIGASGPNASSSLYAQIYVDGVLKSIGSTGTGTDLNAAASYQF
jgi:hypothetical protein